MAGRVRDRPAGIMGEAAWCWSHRVQRSGRSSFLFVRCCCCWYGLFFPSCNYALAHKPKEVCQSYNYDNVSLSLSLSLQAWKVNFLSIFYFVHIISGNLNSYSLLCSSGVYFFFLILGTVTGSMKAFVGFLFCFCFSRGFRSLFHTLSRWSVGEFSKPRAAKCFILWLVQCCFTSTETV